MARVRETKVPFGERLGKAISAVGKGITEVQTAQRESEKFEMMKAQTQQAMQMNEMRMQEVQAQMKQAQELQMAGAKNEVLDMALSYSQAKDKKKWKEANMDSWMQMAPKAGLDVTKFDNVFAPLDVYGEDLAPAYAGIKQGLNVTKTSQWDSLTPAARDASYQGMISGYDSLIQKTSGDKRKYWIEEKRNADKDWQARILKDQEMSGRLSIEREKTTRKDVQVGVTPEARAARQVLGKQAGEASAAANEALARNTSLDRLMALVDKVFTGPIAGTTMGLQKIVGAIGKEGSKEEAQEFDLLLKGLVVDKIMEFAQKAGVRSIDTEKEQQFLKDSLANKNLSPATLKTILLRTKALNERVKAMSDAKLQYISEGGDATNVKAMNKYMQGIEAYVSPQGDVVIAEQGSEIPDGFINATKLEPSFFKKESKPLSKGVSNALDLLK